MDKFGVGEEARNVYERIEFVFFLGMKGFFDLCEGGMNLVFLGEKEIGRVMAGERGSCERKRGCKREGRRYEICMHLYIFCDKINFNKKSINITNTLIIKKIMVCFINITNTIIKKNLRFVTV